MTMAFQVQAQKMWLGYPSKRLNQVLDNKFLMYVLNEMDIEAINNTRPLFFC